MSNFEAETYPNAPPLTHEWLRSNRGLIRAFLAGDLGRCEAQRLSGERETPWTLTDPVELRAEPFEYTDRKLHTVKIHTIKRQERERVRKIFSDTAQFKHFDDCVAVVVS